MELAQIITVATIIVTWVLGMVAKKVTWFNNKMIPLQNIFVGIIVAVIEWIITKDFKVAIALSGLIAGGTYDIFHNLEKLIKGE